MVPGRVVSFLALILAVVLPINAEGQALDRWTVESNNSVIAHKNTPQINLYAVSTQKDQSVNNFAWILVQPGYGEGLIGVLVKPAPWMELGGSFGAEFYGVRESGMRASAQAFIGRGKVSFFGVVEDGASGEWHKATLMYQLHQNFSAGVLDQRFRGLGPRLQASYRKYNLWVAPYLYDTEDKNGPRKAIIALNATF